MGKRQLRISGKNIPANTAVLSGKEVNLLMKNHTVFHGIITGWNEQSVFLENMRLNKHAFLISQIDEVIIDNVSLY